MMGVWCESVYSGAGKSLVMPNWCEDRIDRDMARLLNPTVFISQKVFMKSFGKRLLITYMKNKLTDLCGK